MHNFMGSEEGIDRRREKRVLRAAILRHAQPQLAVGVGPEGVESTVLVDGQSMRFAASDRGPHRCINGLRFVGFVVRDLVTFARCYPLDELRRQLQARASTRSLDVALSYPRIPYLGRLPQP